MSDRTNWRKSSHSSSGGGECVEVAGDARLIMVRDTKQPRPPAPARTIITFTPTAWREFTTHLK